VLIPRQQHSAHTLPCVITGAPTPNSASVATTRPLCGSTRSSRVLDCDTHSAPASAAIPTTQQPSRIGGRPTVATTRLVWGSTREIAQPFAAHTAVPSAATAMTRPSGRWAVTGDGVDGDKEGGECHVVVATGLGGRKLSPVRRPAISKATSTTATAAMGARVLRESRILHLLRNILAGFLSLLGAEQSLRPGQQGPSATK
jgi:hypothetical protein